jgi:hypothetical protein
MRYGVPLKFQRGTSSDLTELRIGSMLLPHSKESASARNHPDVK